MDAKAVNDSTQPRRPGSGSRPPVDPLAGLSAWGLMAGLVHARDQRSQQSTAPLTWRPPAPRKLEKLLTDWEILRLLGRGGMGAVYHARCRRTAREVALKILPPEFSAHPFFVERFEREAAMMTRCQHANIVAVIEPARIVGGVLFFVMEFVEGKDLARHQGGKPMPVDAALGILRQVCDALEHAHRLGLVHRDLKPANVLIDATGHVKVTDFGLAQTLVGGGAASCTMTLTGQVLGTVDYLAPEQIEGLTVDHRADLFAAGVLLYQMLTGHPPRGAWHPPSAISGADQRLDAIVTKALREDPDARYSSAAELRADLAAACVKVRSSRWRIAAAVLGLSALAAPAVFMAWSPASPASAEAPPRRVQPGVDGTAVLLANLADVKLGAVPPAWSRDVPLVRSGPGGVTVEMAAEIEGHLPVWNERLDLSACSDWFLAADVVVGSGNQTPEVLVRLETTQDALRVFSLPLTGLEPGRETRVVTQRPLSDPGQYTLWNGRILTRAAAVRRFTSGGISRLGLHVWPRLRAFLPVEVTVKRFVLVSPTHANARPLPWFPQPHPDPEEQGRAPAPESDGSISLADLTRRAPDMLTPGWLEEPPVTNSSGLHFRCPDQGMARIVSDPLDLRAAVGWRVKMELLSESEPNSPPVGVRFIDPELDMTDFLGAVEGSAETGWSWVSTKPLEASGTVDLSRIAAVWLFHSGATSTEIRGQGFKSLRLVPPTSGR